MRAVIQRVRSASVTIDARVVSRIDQGLLVLAGFEKGDSEAAIDSAAKKIRELRIFSDSAEKMNLSVSDVGGAILAVSQFTLAGSVAKGRRPGFDRAEEPTRANELLERFVRELGAEGTKVKTGVFGAMMVVTLENDGPVTFVLETPFRGG